MATGTAISVEDYLNSSFEWTPDYLEGVLAERPMPSTLHSEVQAELIAIVKASRTGTGLYPYPEIHLPVTPERYRVADIAIFDGPAERPYPKRLPLGVIEVLSPHDAYSQIVERLQDYHAWGVPNIWLIDPEHSAIHRFDGRSLLAVDEIAFGAPAFRIEGARLFAAIA